MSLADTCCELAWLHNLFKTFGFYKFTFVTLYCDSKSSLYIASNLVFHERTKHIDIECHVVREKLLQDFINPDHISISL